jgi:pyrroline-5-carboxylate reductase
LVVVVTYGLNDEVKADVAIASFMPAFIFYFVIFLLNAAIL